MTYYLFSSNSEPYGFVPNARLKNRFHVQEKKKYFEGGKKDKVFFIKWKGKTNHSHLEHRPKSFQPTKHELRKNTKRMKISKLPY